MINLSLPGNLSNHTAPQFHNSPELWTIIGIFTIMSNTVLLVCICNSKFTRNLFHVLLGSTFMISILLGIFFIFPMYSDSDYIHTAKYCTLMPMLSSSFTFNYLLHHLLISIDQHYRIRWPRHYCKFNGKKRWIVIVAVLWLVAHIVMAIPIMVYFQLQAGQCLNPVNSDTFITLFYAYFVGFFIFPTGVIAINYILIYYFICKKYSKVNSFSRSATNLHRPQKKNKAHIIAMRMGVLALILFVMVYPFAFPMLAIYFRYRDNWILSIADVSRYFAVSYSALNPLLYSCLIRTVKRSLLENMYRLQQILSDCFTDDA